jgi:hypothetical protein
MIWKLCGSADQFLRVFHDISGRIVVCPSAFVAAYLMEIMARRCKLVDARTPRRRQEEPREANSIISTHSARSGRKERRDNPPEMP